MGILEESKLNVHRKKNLLSKIFLPIIMKGDDFLLTSIPCRILFSELIEYYENLMGMRI